MPTADEQRDAVIQRVTRLAQPNVHPTVSSRDVEAIVDATARASVWTAATAYIFGNVILPTVRNGHSYMCVIAGTSGATEPIWPTSQQATITDGASDPLLKWQEAGPDFDNLYDVRKAAHEIWLQKAAQASQLYATSQSGSKFEHQQVHDHCVKMSEKYASLEIG